MSSFLFCTSYIDNRSRDHQSLRYDKWINYYSGIADELGVRNIFIFDDAGPATTEMASMDLDVIEVERGLPSTLRKTVNIFAFHDHLGRSSVDKYPGWWRSFTYSIVIARKYGFNKIVHIESDFYILSDRLIRFICGLDKGWTSLFSAYYGFPETAVQVIAEDSFHKLELLYAEAISSQYTFGHFAELILPISNVIKDFVGDRLGEVNVLLHWAATRSACGDVDYYGQLPSHVRPWSSEELQTLIKSLVNKSDPAGNPRAV